MDWDVSAAYLLCAVPLLTGWLASLLAEQFPSLLCQQGQTTPAGDAEMLLLLQHHQRINASATSNGVKPLRGNVMQIITSGAARVYYCLCLQLSQPAGGLLQIDCCRLRAHSFYRILILNNYILREIVRNNQQSHDDSVGRKWRDLFLGGSRNRRERREIRGEGVKVRVIVTSVLTNAVPWLRVDSECGGNSPVTTSHL